MRQPFSTCTALLCAVLMTTPATFAADISAVDAQHVRLLPGGPFFDRQELHRTGYLASWDPDKLLSHYRALAKLPQKEGVKGGYDGWDSGFIRGHMLGHYLSAASRMAVATGDNAYRDKVNYIVVELGKCQEALNQDGYLAAFSTGAFDQLEGKPRANGGGIVVPYYTVQKILSGLLDAHHYLGNKQALDIAVKMAAYFGKRLAGLTPQQIEKIFNTDGSRNPQNEFGAMSDALAELYRATGDNKHLEAARLFNRDWFVGPLARGEDNLANLHGNTHIAQALGIAHCANLEKDANELKASEYFWRLVTREHAFVNGGNTFKEWLDKPNVEVGKSVDGQTALPPTTAETCNTHNMLKLTSRLFERNPQVEYADYYERALYNHILASVAPDTGFVTYFTPLRGQFRTYLTGTFCCVGSGIENTARYNEAIYFQQDRNLWVNLYIPSELDWKQTGMKLKQEGDITHGEPVKFTVVQAGNQSATMKFRIPGWVSKSATLAVNGKVEENAAKADTYVALERNWKAGDVITLTLPASLRIEQAKDDASIVSIFYGPVLLAGELGRDNMPKDVGEKDANLKASPVPVPEIANTSRNPADWLQSLPSDKTAFKMQNAGPADGIIFRPLFELHHQRYSVYWRLRMDAAKANP
jgi:uncharacterized protein